MTAYQHRTAQRIYDDSFDNVSPPTPDEGGSVNPQAWIAFCDAMAAYHAKEAAGWAKIADLRIPVYARAAARRAAAHDRELVAHWEERATARRKALAEVEAEAAQRAAESGRGTAAVERLIDDGLIEPAAPTSAVDFDKLLDSMAI